MGTLTEIGRPELDGTYGQGQVNLYEQRFLVRQFSSQGGVVLDLTGSAATGALASSVEGRNAIYIDGDTARIYDAFCRTDRFFETELKKIKALNMLPEEEVQTPGDDAVPYGAGAVREKETPSEQDVAALMKELEVLLAYIARRRVDPVPDVAPIVKFWLSEMALQNFRSLSRDPQILDDMIEKLDFEDLRTKMKVSQT